MEKVTFNYGQTLFGIEECVDDFLLNETAKKNIKRSIEELGLD